MDEELRTAFAGLGLTAHEASILAALLERSPASASFLAKATGISRSSAYTTLDGLVAKGLVGVSHTNEVKQFTAAGHAALMELLERQSELASARVERAEALRSRFEARPDASAHVPEVVTFEGLRGLQRVYLQMLREARTAGPLLIVRDEFVWRERWGFVHEPEWRQRVARLKALTGLETRLLVHRSADELQRAADYRGRRATETRFLPEAVRLDGFACYVLEDVVSLLSFDGEALTGIRIANRPLARGVAALFGFLWESSSPDPS